MSSSRHAFTTRHSITLRPIGGITPEEIQSCLTLLSNMISEHKVLRAVVGKEVIDRRHDSAHLHIRLIYHKNYRSCESTKLFKDLFEQGRLSAKSIKTTQPNRSMMNQSEDVFWSYALKDSFTDPSSHWLFNVEMTPELQAACHEMLLTHLERQKPIIVLTSTNVVTVMKDYTEKHNVSFEQAFVDMYLSTDPVYQMNFISCRKRMQLSIAMQENPSEVHKLLLDAWNSFLGSV